SRYSACQCRCPDAPKPRRPCMGRPPRRHASRKDCCGDRLTAWGTTSAATLVPRFERKRPNAFLTWASFSADPSPACKEGLIMGFRDLKDLVRKAAEARVQAETMTKPELRWLMLDIARQFEKLAEEIDQLEALQPSHAFHARGADRHIPR